MSARKLQGKEIVIDSNLNANQPVDGYKIIHSSILTSMINICSKCPNCGCEKNLSVQQCEKNREGLSEELVIVCNSCEEVLTTTKTSPNVGQTQKMDINLRSVYAITTTGGGLASLRSFCSGMNFPPPVYPNSFTEYMRHISNVAALHCQESMNTAASLRRKDNELAKVSVSVDGTWQKRYGHNSLLGASFVLSVDSGQVLDYAIKSKTCQLCKRNPDATAEWKKKHEPVCEINHTIIWGHGEGCSCRNVSKFSRAT